ncbi:coagulation factor II (thrombin) receptor-like 1, tandem duplicate 2 [Chanos chanos]|uniref:Coagulation factor II (Thrombin) receptor-like 1, tandem duplicate 2 n=1 Tax=Chanos chanos TaxID=29144 RepID=A0A6J2UXI6_CHACN|nr:proteinase-activated receptor 2-like [Chanos chanos]
MVGYYNQQTRTVDVDDITEQVLTSSLTTVFLPVVYIVVFAVALPTNAMAIWVFLFRTNKMHPAAIYMANLALADLLFVIWIPLKIAYHLNGNNWTFGEELCKVFIGFFYGNMYCSILFIACLSVQRYWVVAHPLSQQRKNNTVAIIASVCIWVFIWVSTTPLYLTPQTAQLTSPNITTCHDVNVIHSDPAQDALGEYEKRFEYIQHSYYYFMVMAGMVCFVPSLVIIVAYVLLLRALGVSKMDVSSNKKRQKAVLLIVTVLITFLVCFIPSNVTLVIHYVLVKNGVKNHGYGFYITTLCLSSLNSCLDPFIYYYVSEDFRDHVKNTLLCRSDRTVKRMKVSFSSMKYSKRTNTYTSETQTSSC